MEAKEKEKMQAKTNGKGEKLFGHLICNNDVNMV